MALSPAAKKLALLGGVALSLHIGFLFIKPIIAPESKADDKAVLERLKSI